MVAVRHTAPPRFIGCYITMPKEFSRTRRVAEQMQRELAQLIREEIRDPRVGMITLSGVEVARDMAHAKIFFTLLDEQQHEPAVSVAILNKAAGFLRHALGQRMIMRAVPQLHFQYDDTTARGAHINALIDAALAKDAHKESDDE